MYGAPSEEPPLAWDWVDGKLADSDVYWVVAQAEGHPHPRPVWGVWADSSLHLSIGSPSINAAIERQQDVTVHLGGATDVVIVEGTLVDHRADDDVIAAYDLKYDWDYDAEEYGRLAVVRPDKVIAWRSAGWAGREGFKQTGRWRIAAASGS